MGTLIDRVHRELTDEDMPCLADTDHALQGRGEGNAKTKKGTVQIEDMMARLASELSGQFDESAKLATAIGSNLMSLDFEL